MEDLVRIPDLARLSKLSEATVGRYIKEYRDYIPHKEIRGDLYFPSQVLAMLQYINGMKKERKPFEIVSQSLQNDFPQVYDVMMEERQQQVGKELTVTTDVLAKLVELLDQKQEINQLRQENNDLRRRMDRIDERDSKVMEFIREKQKEREGIVQKARRAVEKLFGRN